MTGSLHHRARFAGTCYQQGQQGCAAMRPVFRSREDISVHQVFVRAAGTGKPVVISVWNKTTGAGNQN